MKVNLTKDEVRLLIHWCSTYENCGDNFEGDKLIASALKKLILAENKGGQ